jgi:ubiquinone/menaquinone biosynthesis C-methylase UbiE
MARRFGTLQATVLGVLADVNDDCVSTGFARSQRYTLGAVVGRVDSKERFSDRVDDYVRYRPGYPLELRDLFVRVCRLGPGRVVADVGSGTGILSRTLLATGARVIGVEPNSPMRGAAERAFSEDANFVSLAGSAEATTLEDASVDAIAAGQAFHWFDPSAARIEFARVLRAGGYVVLAWNRRKDSPLDRDYEAMLDELAPDYAHVRARDRASSGPGLEAFFAPSAVTFVRFDNEQRFDEEGLRGRLASSSYAPRPGEANHGAIMERLGKIFQIHAVGGVVTFLYDTEVWYGRLDGP